MIQGVYSEIRGCEAIVHQIQQVETGRYQQTYMYVPEDITALQAYIKTLQILIKPLSGSSGRAKCSRTIYGKPIVLLGFLLLSISRRTSARFVHLHSLIEGLLGLLSLVAIFDAPSSARIVQDYIRVRGMWHIWLSRTLYLIK